MARSSRPNPFWALTKLIVVLVVAGVLAAGFFLPYVGGLGLAASHEADKFLNTKCTLQVATLPEKSQFLASDGKTVIATIFQQDRQPVPLSEVPMSLQQALIATEDRRFYSHHGVDIRGLIRSALKTSNGDTQGGSTLTMQYVKQVRYYEAGNDLAKQNAAIAQTLTRKIEDAKCALYIENVEHQSKATILDNYLNIAFFGENSYGIETAAETYFDKTVSQLTLPESALLVGLLQAPSAYDPFVYPQAARERRNQVLQNLVAVHDLTQAQADAYAATPISLATQAPPLVHEDCASAPNTAINIGFFCDYVVNWLETVDGITDQQLETGGLRVVTTLNVGLQNAMQTAVFKSMPATSPMAAVLPVVDPHTGNVIAMVTSKKYGTQTSATDNTHTSLPIFTTYTAEAASTYKLFPLLTALGTGVPTDWKLKTTTGTSKDYTTTNCTTKSTVSNGDADETYSTNETLQDATAKSSNTYFVGLADQLLGCYLQPIVDVANSLGMKGLEQPSDLTGLNIGQSVVTEGRASELVLGDITTSPLELTSAYAAVANDGMYNQPAPIISITQGSLKLPVKRSPGVQVVSPQVARQAVQVLTGDTKPPGTSAAAFTDWYKNKGSIVAGKTGTSVAYPNDTLNSSMWFVGMTPNLVATSAVFNIDSPSSPASGLPGIKDPAKTAYGAFASGIWVDALGSYLRHDASAWSWPSPDSVNGIPVPPIIGLDEQTALQTLSAAGFKGEQVGGDTAGIECPSTQKYQTVAFSAPTIAPKGATITYCLSSNVPAIVYHKPTPTKSKTPSGSGSGSSSGTSSGSTSPSGGHSSSSPGHGSSTSPGHGGPTIPVLPSKTRTKPPGH